MQWLVTYILSGKVYIYIFFFILFILFFRKRQMQVQLELIDLVLTVFAQYLCCMFFGSFWFFLTFVYGQKDESWTIILLFNSSFQWFYIFEDLHKMKNLNHIQFQKLNIINSKKMVLVINFVSVKSPVNFIVLG